MNWLTNFVRPKLKALVTKSQTPDNLWHKCKGCSTMIFHRDLEKNMHVCPHCDYHMRITARERLDMLFDKGEYELIKIPPVKIDPLKFKDQKKYPDRLKEAKAKTGLDDAALSAYGKINGQNVVICAFDFHFMGGSMGMAVGEALVAAADYAVSKKAAFVTIPASGGARMQEGILSLMQLPRSIVALRRVKDHNLPYIVVLTDPTTGGVSASFAMLGDVHIAEKGAMIGFAGARVIEKTIKEALPEGFQTAEYLYEHGMVDIVCTRSDLKDKLGNIIKILMIPHHAKH